MEAIPSFEPPALRCKQFLRGKPELEVAIFRRFIIAENTDGSRWSLALLRWALVIVFLWFGSIKFTSYEAHGNAPLIDHSPIMSWMNVVFGVQG